MKELSLRENQLVALDILKVVARVCEQEGFKYYLAYGTLIGAVRHNGFIPWDDDIDIWMPRQDYMRMLKYFENHKEELKPLAVYNQFTCVKYPYMITRISDERYWLDVVNEEDYGIGAFIDIYVLDGFGIDYDNAVKTAFTAKKNASYLFQATRQRFQMGLTKGLKRKILKFPVYCFAKLMGKKYFIDKLQRLSEKNSYETSKYIGCISWCVNLEREIMDKEWFSEGIKQKFEDEEFYIPTFFDKILTQIYGDYMQLPPEQDRIPHHLYKTFKK